MNEYIFLLHLSRLVTFHKAYVKNWYKTTDKSILNMDRLAKSVNHYPIQQKSRTKLFLIILDGPFPSKFLVSQYTYIWLTQGEKKNLVWLYFASVKDICNERRPHGQGWVFSKENPTFINSIRLISATPRVRSLVL